MAGVIDLEKLLADHTASLYRETLVNDRFKQLRDENEVEKVYIFFEKCEKHLDEMDNLLHQQERVDFKTIDVIVCRIMLSSFIVGAQRVKYCCTPIIHYCEGQSIQGCLNHLPILKTEFIRLKAKLETLFRLEKQVLESGGSIPNH